jgi:hypothetical protein
VRCVNSIYWHESRKLRCPKGSRKVSEHPQGVPRTSHCKSRHRYVTLQYVRRSFSDLRTDGPQSDDLLRPVFMGCATKNAKVVAISLGSLQRLIALKAVPQSAVPLIITTMSDSVSQGVDIQLRILQTLLSLITNFPAVHGALLGDVSAHVDFLPGGP